MEKSTMGSFIAALRKANGLTQQDLADKLAVSNKAVSRWERDECAPDISLIAPIAEIFGITADELLRGERIIKNAEQKNDNTEDSERIEPKAEKQLKLMVKRSIYLFKTMMYVAIGFAVAGLVAMYGFMGGFLSPMGPILLLLLEIVASVVAMFAMSRMKEMNNDEELFERANADLSREMKHVYSTYAFECLFAIATAILMSICLLIIVGWKSIDTLYQGPAHFEVFFMGLVTVFSLRFMLEKPCKRYFSGERPCFDKYPGRKTVIWLNIAQWVLFAIWIIIIRSIVFNSRGSQTIHVVLCWITVLLFIVTNVAFILLIKKMPESKLNAYVSLGRNTLLFIVGIIMRLSVGANFRYIDQEVVKGCIYAACAIVIAAPLVKRKLKEKY